MYNCKVYKIINSIDDEIYIGSTKNTLSRRMAEHRRSCKKEEKKNIILYIHMKKHGIDNFFIEIIEEKEVSSRSQQLMLEAKWQREIKPCLNQLYAHCTDEQHKEYHKQYDKKYREKHRYKLNIKSKEYYEENKESIKITNKKWREENKELIYENNKAYREANKEKIKVDKKAYREANKEKIKKKNRLEYLENKEKIKKRSHDRYHNNKEKNANSDNQNSTKEENRNRINARRRELYRLKNIKNKETLIE